MLTNFRHDGVALSQSLTSPSGALIALSLSNPTFTDLGVAQWSERAIEGREAGGSMPPTGLSIALVEALRLTASWPN